eukprot:gene31127-40478_t
MRLVLHLTIQGKILDQIVQQIVGRDVRVAAPQHSDDEHSKNRVNVVSKTWFMGMSVVEVLQHTRRAIRCSTRQWTKWISIVRSQKRKEDQRAQVTEHHRVAVQEEVGRTYVQLHGTGHAQNLDDLRLKSRELR